MINLSKRLLSVAGLVPKSSVVADIGCDHAHVAIYLIENNLADKVIACDVNKGPLAQARGNVEGHGLTDRIEMRLSDGLENINCGEAESIIIAGMGGPLMVKIISEGRSKIGENTSLILQPQSDIYSFRSYLKDNGFEIIKEDMVYEDGKYYPMMLAVQNSDNNKELPVLDSTDEEANLEYGKLLIRDKNPVLREYLIKEEKQLVKILEELKSQGKAKKAEKRIEEIQKKLYVNQNAMRRL